MAVSEKDRLVATQIAYANLDKAFYALKKEGKEVTLSEAFKYAKEHGDSLLGIDNYIKGYTRNEKGTIIGVEFIEGYSHIGDWKLMQPVNDNVVNGTGFCACILDTGYERILACRGSESMDNMLHFKQDWYEADFKLLNSEQTKQEAALRKYMTENADLLQEKPWVSTGHSLGGALADHAAVISAEEKIGNFSGATNFDGPGHSQEYIKKHSEALEQVAHKMIHKKASVVGNLLFNLPGVKQEFIKTSDESRFLDKNGNPKSIAANFFERHDTVYWVLDENGNTIETTQPIEGFLFEKLSRAIERLPPFIGNMLPEIVLLVAEGSAWWSEFSKNNPELVKAGSTAAVAYILSHPAIIKAAVDTVAALLTIVLIAVIGEIVLENLETIAKDVANTLCATVSWLKGKTAELFEAVANVINNIRKWNGQKTNKGVSYVQSNPYFKADTEKLREYAVRLERVNNRLSKLDSNMRSLYWQVGLLDLWDILLANMITSKSYAINQAKKYLYNTADRFENAENKAKNYIGG